jgi:hypothetical protein
LFENVTAHQPSRLRRFGWQAGVEREGCPSKPNGRRRACSDEYVYLLESIDHPDETYVGLTDDLKARFAAHNAGRSPHTSKFEPLAAGRLHRLFRRPESGRFRTLLEVRFRKGIRQQAVSLNVMPRRSHK